MENNRRVIKADVRMVNSGKSNAPGAKLKKNSSMSIKSERAINQ